MEKGTGVLFRFLEERDRREIMSYNCDDTDKDMLEDLPVWLVCGLSVNTISIYIEPDKDKLNISVIKY